LSGAGEIALKKGINCYLFSDLEMILGIQRGIKIDLRVAHKKRYEVSKILTGAVIVTGSNE